MNWKIGDIAICVNIFHVGHTAKTNGKYPPLQYNTEYIVKEVYECIKCKRISLDVGFSTPDNKGIICICSHFLPNNGVYWCASERFVKKGIGEEQENKENKKEVVHG